MLEVKTFFGEWKNVTKEEAECFYNHFYEHATAIATQDKRRYFNEHCIKGGHVLLNGKIETVEEQKKRVFRHYKDMISSKVKDNGKVRFIVIEYVCRDLGINPYEMAASILTDKVSITYDDSSISIEENRRKQKRVLFLKKGAVR